MKPTALMAWIIATGDAQNFLGAPWVRRAVERAPQRAQRRVALWALSLSPHYFDSGKRPDEEARRLRTTRAQLAQDLLGEHLQPAMEVLDLGCGPGDMALAVSRSVTHVFALDVSPGVLACARVLAAADNISYMTPDAYAALGRRVDLAYSIAVAQHLSDDVLRRTLGSLHTWIRPGGTLVLHVVLDAPGWMTEAEWRADHSLRGRLRLRYGLNCFSRREAAMRAMVADAGFEILTLRPLSEVTAVSDDVAGQHLLTARNS
jgi:SAM-dependent methyltransferase